jgi:hypothetical protein
VPMSGWAFGTPHRRSPHGLSAHQAPSAAIAPVQGNEGHALLRPAPARRASAFLSSAMLLSQRLHEIDGAMRHLLDLFRLRRHAGLPWP